jgi:hypothetical protein
MQVINEMTRKFATLAPSALRRACIIYKVARNQKKYRKALSRSKGICETVVLPTEEPKEKPVKQRS